MRLIAGLCLQESVKLALVATMSGVAGAQTNSSATSFHPAFNRPMPLPN